MSKNQIIRRSAVRKQRSLSERCLCCYDDSSVSMISMISVFIQSTFIVLVLGGLFGYYFTYWNREMEVCEYIIFMYIKIGVEFTIIASSIFLFVSVLMLFRKNYMKSIVYGVMYVMLTTVEVVILVGVGVYYTANGANHLQTKQFQNSGLVSVRTDADNRYFALMYKAHTGYLVWGIVYIVAGVILFIFNIVTLSYILILVNNKEKFDLDFSYLQKYMKKKKKIEQGLSGSDSDSEKEEKVEYIYEYVDKKNNASGTDVTETEEEDDNSSSSSSSSDSDEDNTSEELSSDNSDYSEYSDD